MSHVLEILPPPDLSYPPDELDLNRPALTYEMSHTRTRPMEDNQPTKPQVSDEMTFFLIIVDRFISERDGRRVCTMCGYVQNPWSLGPC
jgi:hypothetical protein